MILLLAATLFHVEPTNGTVGFSLMKWGVIREDGTFRDFSARIEYDAANVAKSRVDFDVKTASLDTKNSNRDSTVKSEEFLDVEKYPLMTFRSVRVAPRAKNVADVTGDLTIHGVTKRVTVPVRLIGTNRSNGRDFAGFETSFVIKRKDFNVTGGDWVAHAPGILGEDVTIHIVAGGVTK